jgi:hypothetical protein
MAIQYYGLQLYCLRCVGPDAEMTADSFSSEPSTAGEERPNDPKP